MLDELTNTNQGNEHQNTGEEEAPIPFDFDPELLPTVHVFESPGRFTLMTDEAFHKQQVRNQHTDSTPPEPRKPPDKPKALVQKEKSRPFFPFYLLILLFFLLFDSGTSYLGALFAPTATITIQPRIQNITLHTSTTTGTLLSPITISQSQTVPTTGHGHQDAKHATGSLTFYNGLFTSQYVPSGTEFTGSDGVQIVTNESVTIPSGNPPSYGQATVSAYAISAGASGNIQAYDIHTTIANGVSVKNTLAFFGGQNSRDFMVVTKADRDTGAANLQAKVAASMSAALQGQLLPGQTLQPTPCTPKVTTNHAIGEEATTLQVAVSQTCTALAYDPQAITNQATQLLTSKARKTLGIGYTLSGTIQVHVTQALIKSPSPILLSFTCQGTYVYQLNGTVQQRMKLLVAGKPRSTALHELTALPGIQMVSINGIPDDQPLPSDMSHIRLLLIMEG